MFKEGQGFLASMQINKVERCKKKKKKKKKKKRRGFLASMQLNTAEKCLNKDRGFWQACIYTRQKSV